MSGNIPDPLTMKSPELKLPSAFVYDQPGDRRLVTYQVLTEDKKQIVGRDVPKLKSQLKIEQIDVENIHFITREQIANLNLMPADFIRPFDPEEKWLLKNS